MVLIDKNNIISINFTKNNLSEDVNFINTFLENYLINKNKVVSTYYIYNLLNYHENNTETRVESFNSKVNDSILLNISLFVKKKIARDKWGAHNTQQTRGAYVVCN